MRCTAGAFGWALNESLSAGSGILEAHRLRPVGFEYVAIRGRIK